MTANPVMAVHSYVVYGRNGLRVVVDCPPGGLRGETEALIRQLGGIETVTRLVGPEEAVVNKGLWWESPGPAMRTPGQPWYAALAAIDNDRPGLDPPDSRRVKRGAANVNRTVAASSTVDSSALFGEPVGSGWREVTATLHVESAYSGSPAAVLRDSGSPVWLTDAGTPDPSQSDVDGA